MAAKLSGKDLFEYNEILLSAHSWSIEGNSFSFNNTGELKEHGLKLKLFDKCMLEAFEIMVYFKAYEYLFKILNFRYLKNY